MVKKWQCCKKKCLALECEYEQHLIHIDFRRIYGMFLNPVGTNHLLYSVISVAKEMNEMDKYKYWKRKIFIKLEIFKPNEN